MNKKINRNYKNDLLELKKLQASFENNFESVIDTKFSHVPEGEYVVSVISTGLTRSKNGTIQHVWILQIALGEYQGEFLIHRNSLTQSERTISQLFYDLGKCDPSIQQISELLKEETSKKLIGKKLLVKVKQNPPPYEKLFDTLFI